jgi:hypothetical protein
LLFSNYADGSLTLRYVRAVNEDINAVTALPPKRGDPFPGFTARTRAAKRGKSLRQLKKFHETDTLILLKGRGLAE